jgi:hypothetical protein
MKEFSIVDNGSDKMSYDIIDNENKTIASYVHWLYAQRITDILNQEAKCSQCKQLANSLKNVSDSFVAQVEYTTQVLIENKRLESYLKKPNK